MTRFLLYLAVAYILWRVVRSWTRSARSPREPRDRTPRERFEARSAGPIDYGQIRDARYRDISAGRSGGAEATGQRDDPGE